VGGAEMVKKSIINAHSISLFFSSRRIGDALDSSAYLLFSTSPGRIYRQRCTLKRQWHRQRHRLVISPLNGEKTWRTRTRGAPLISRSACAALRGRKSAESSSSVDKQARRDQYYRPTAVTSRQVNISKGVAADASWYITTLPKRRALAATTAPHTTPAHLYRALCAPRDSGISARSKQALHRWRALITSASQQRLRTNTVKRHMA